MGSRCPFIANDAFYREKCEEDCKLYKENEWMCVFESIMERRVFI